MALSQFTVHLRLLSPVLLAFVAWIVWRTPYQERANRLLASFLTVLAVGFAVEVLWDMARGEFDGFASWARTVENALGFLDPPVLLAFALVVARPQRSRLVALWVVYGVVGSLLFLTGEMATGRIRTDWFPLAHVLYVNGTYLAAFVILLEAFRHEERPFMARQLRFVVLGVGFAALSRSAALFLAGGPVLLRGPTMADQMWWSTVVTLLILAVVGGGFGLRARLLRRSGRPTLGLVLWLGVMAAGFYGLWLLVTLWLAGTPFDVVSSYYFTFRWVVVAAVVAFGILRFQLFDFELRTRQVVSLLVASVLGVAAAMATGYWASEAGLALLPARLVGIPAAALVAFGVFVLSERMGRSFETEEDLREREHRRRLEIYQATLEFALEKPEWSAEERRFVETLREVFEVSPEDHQRVVARLRERLPPVGRGGPEGPTTDIREG